MRAHEFINEIERLDEVPLPQDWDKDVFSLEKTPNQAKKTSFKARLDYAIERAQKIGTGSSRVAFIIEFEGRPTVIKIAKNTKGLAQNATEARILGDSYIESIGIAIPFIDYDSENNQPVWIQTELAQKVTEPKLCKMLHCVNLYQLVDLAYAIRGERPFPSVYWKPTDDGGWNHIDPTDINNYYEALILKGGWKRDDIELMNESAEALAALRDFNLELVEFTRSANWGVYDGEPVIIDLGFDKEVQKTHYSR